MAVNYGFQVGERGSPGEPRQIGDSATENNTFFYNLDLPVGVNGSFYGHGGYNGREGDAGAWYRGGVGSDDIPSRNSAQMYPDGFVPDIGSGIRDYAAAFGYRTLLGSWSADVSTNYGSNRMEYRIHNTLNASIAAMNNGLSPTEFDAGGFQFDQHTTNLDFSRYYKERLRGVSVAAGLEYRRESHEIFAGEPGSYADFDGPGGGNAGSQGFPGSQRDRKRRPLGERPGGLQRRRLVRAGGVEDAAGVWSAVTTVTALHNKKRRACARRFSLRDERVR